MTTRRDVELCVCETYACLAVARYVAYDRARFVPWVTTRDVASFAAGEAAWVTTRGTAVYEVGHADVAWESAWAAIGREAREVASTAISKMMSEGKDDWQAVGIETARATLHYVITNEEVIYSAISSALPRAAMLATCNHEDVITRMLDLHPNYAVFEQMNLGGQCWYLSRVWCLIDKAKLAASCAQKLFKLASECDRKVTDFVNWMVPPSYSRAEFLEVMMMSSELLLLPPLLDIVYDYLSAPHEFS